MKISKQDTIKFYVTHQNEFKQVIHTVFDSYLEALKYANTYKNQTRYINLRVRSNDGDGFSSSIAKFNKFNDLEIIHGHYLNQLKELSK